VAVVDARARTAQGLQANLPALNAMFNSISILRNVGGGTTANRNAASGRLAEIAGLYVGYRLEWHGNPFGGVASGTWQPGPYFYLLSPEGRVQRGYRLPRTPNGDITLFDYDAARREAPNDSGSYELEGPHVTFIMGSDTVVADITPEGNLLIGGSLFQKPRTSPR
jgi:hypothetical protein